MVPRPCGANTNTKKLHSPKTPKSCYQKGAENGAEIERASAIFQAVFSAFLRLWAFFWLDIVAAVILLNMTE